MFSIIIKFSICGKVENCYVQIIKEGPLQSLYYINIIYFLRSTFEFSSVRNYHYWQDLLKTPLFFKPIIWINHNNFLQFQALNLLKRRKKFYFLTTKIAHLCNQQYDKTEKDTYKSLKILKSEEEIGSIWNILPLCKV